MEITATTAATNAGNGADPVAATADKLIADARRSLGGNAYVDTEDLARAVHSQRSTTLEIAVQARLTPVERGDYARALDRVAEPAGALGQIMGANGDFLRNYDDMRAANTIGGDKYFHCKANFEAAQRGSYGAGRAAFVSDAREWVDQNLKGDPASASAADQVANLYGRDMARFHPGMMGREACDVFRPNGLDARY